MTYAIIEKYKALSVQSKSAIWFVFCSILQKGISFITVPLFTRLLTTEEYGTYSLYLSWFQIMTMVTSLYLYHGVFNNGMNKFDTDRDAYISSMQALVSIITFAFFGIYLVRKDIWSNLLGLSNCLIILMFIELFVNPAIHFWTGRQRFEFKYKRLVAVTIARSAANPFLGLIMVLAAHDKATARIISVVVTELVFSGCLMIRQFAKGKVFFHPYYWKFALGMAIPLIPHYLSTIILIQGDRVMISHMVGRSEVALYSVAYNVGLLVQIVSSAIISSFTPWLYQCVKARNMSSIKGTVNLLLLLITIIAIGMMLCSPEIVTIFGSSEYRGAAYVIPPVAASVFFIFLYNIIVFPQFYFEKTKFIALFSVAAAGLNILLNYLLIPKFGYLAAGYTTLICYMMYGFGHSYVSKRVLKKNLNGYELFDKRVILLFSFVVVGVCVASNLIFPYWYLRYSLLALICLFLYRKRGMIKMTLSGFSKARKPVIAE